MASGSGTAEFIHDRDGDVAFQGGATEYTAVFRYLSNGAGSSATVTNANTGTLSILGGSGNYAFGIQIGANGTGSEARIQNDGDGGLVIFGGESSYAYGINTMADSGTATISNLSTGTLLITGGSKTRTYGIGTLVKNTGGDATISNESSGALTIKGGSSSYAFGIGWLGGVDGGAATISNQGSGSLTIMGGSYGNNGGGLAANGIYMAASTGGTALITNTGTGTLTITGGSGWNANGIRVLSLEADSPEESGKCTISNTNSGKIILTIGSGSGAYAIDESDGIATILNTGIGTFTISNGGIRSLAFGKSASSTVENTGSGEFTISGGERAYGIDTAAHLGGTAEISNTGTGTLTISGGAGAIFGIGYLARGFKDSSSYSFSSATLSNTGGGTFTIAGGSGTDASGIDFMVRGPGTATIYNAKGTMNILGNIGAGIRRLSSGLEASAFLINADILNLNANAIDTFGEDATFENASTGTVNTEAGALFSGEYSEPDTAIVPTNIAVWNGSGLTTVQTDSFVSSGGVTQTGSLTLKDDWKNYSTWEDGGSITFTDIADGTALADSIRTQFEAAFGTGTSIHFTGTGSGGGSADFTSSIVDDLVAESKFSDGSIITSEVLKLDGEALTLASGGSGWRGWNSVGFAGIRGASSISVKDGRTLTLLGDQAAMSTALLADDAGSRSSTVITDAPMALEGSNLVLGIAALSATQGSLAPVTADAGSTVTAENGIYEIQSLAGDGSVLVKAHESYKTQLTLGSMEATSLENQSILNVTGESTLKSGQFLTKDGAQTTLTGAVTLGEGATLTALSGAEVTTGVVTMAPTSMIANFSGGKMTLDGLVANGFLANVGELTVAGTLKVADAGETRLGGKSNIGTLSVGATQAAQLLSNDFARAIVEGESYVDELELVSGEVDVQTGAVLAGKSLKDGGIGSVVKVAQGGTFAFSYDESGLKKLLEAYEGEEAGKAILALSTDLHFKEGGKLTVGTVGDDSAAVNLGSDALLLVGTDQLHGNALLSGGADQAVHAEAGAQIAFVDDLIWGNHYLLDGFDDASVEEMLDVGIRDKDGKEMDAKVNDRGLYVTIGSDDIREKDAGFRLVENFNFMLDGRQDKDSAHGDVAFLTNALLAETAQGVAATRTVESLNADAGVLSETLRQTVRVQDLVADHALSVRPDSGTLWVEGIYADVDAGNADVDTTGFAFGADAAVGGWHVGAAFTAQRSDLDAQTSSTTSDIDAYGFSVYGAKHFEGGWSLAGSASYVTSTHEMSAQALGKVKAETDVDAFILGVRGAKHFTSGNLALTPYVGLDLVKASEDAFTASWDGKEAFRYGDADATLWRVPVGVKLSAFAPMTFGKTKGTLNVTADFSVAPQFGDKDADHSVEGVFLGKQDAYRATLTDDYVGKAKLGVSYQGKTGAFSLEYEAQKGDVLGLSHSVKAKAALYF